MPAPAPVPVTRHFLGWNRPILELASGWLQANAAPGWPDLSRMLAVVPTRHAGRRLRERLAHLSHEQGMGMLPPRVMPPEALLGFVSQPGPGQGRLASTEESLMAWAEVLLQADLAEFPALFPVAPVAQDLAWALGTADALATLRRSLGEAGLEIANVLDVTGDDLEEADRWQELTHLELLFRSSLARRGLVDLLTVRREHASQPRLPEPLDGIALIGCPDPLPLAVDVLEALSASIPVHVLVHAPAELADAFDPWGRPIAAFWSGRAISFDDFNQQVQVLPGPLAQAEEACRRTTGYDDPAAHVAIGVLDEEVVPLLEERMEAHDVLRFNPQGFTLRSQGAIHLLRTLRNLLREPSVSGFLELLRCADYAAWLSRSAEGWDTASVLDGFDELARKHLPQDLRDMRRILNRARTRDEGQAGLLRFAFRATRTLLRDFSRHPLPRVLPGFLRDIFSSRPPQPGSERDAALQVAARKIPAILEAMSGAMGEHLPQCGAEGLDLLLRFLESESVYPDRAAEAVELLGWLELHWEDAPHLILTGCNDGFVPDSIVGDIYLPEKLRCRLAKHIHLKTNEQRFARDAYLLESMLQARRAAGGRVDLLLGKRSIKGEPLRPSRLLFLCDDSGLASRTRQLFRDVPERDTGAHWTPGFLLRPRGLPRAPEPGIASLTVTAFRDYLSSPFHFYLRHVEQMRAVETDRLEMDAAAFGELLHDALKRLGQNEALRDSTSEKEIGDFLVAQAGALLAARFGPEPVLPVRIQAESARQRLLAAARVQAEQRRDGWRIEQVEAALGGGNWELDGVLIRGRVDRIDRHETSGAIRVLDYKTSESGSAPQPAHMATVTAATRRDWLPPYAVFEAGGKTWRWKDLQLPLYRLGLAEQFGDAIQCGYFTLPKSVAETGVQSWDSLSDEHDEAALRCASGVIGDVLRGRFWPAPAPSWNDDYATLHLGRPEQTIDPTLLQPA